ncbi:hypothetical protein CF319_g6121 [Tilletia indica]|uniref:Uncharacterized protein n=1 Tax=Tilletia indica TaxID=43049 RepID=A0A177T4X0_9BASI|nr:hypothetical protein CF319_g6121 [Tilletia indica]KAE8241745.1 hypothetical protein A4X13_0g7283 [Tilletia indica]
MASSITSSAFLPPTVPRFDSAVRSMDEDYPDYGLPHPGMYATPGPPYVFMGVDFSPPFEAHAFPLPPTFRRCLKLEMYLGACCAAARQAELPFPEHLKQLHQRLRSHTRPNKGRHHRNQASFAGPGSSRSAADGLNQHRLSSSCPTNDRSIVLFLFDAPLSRQYSEQLSHAQCQLLLQQHGWGIGTTLLKAADATLLPTEDLLQVFDPSITDAQRVWIQSRLGAPSVGASNTSTSRPIPLHRTTWRMIRASTRAQQSRRGPPDQNQHHTYAALEAVAGRDGRIFGATFVPGAPLVTRSAHPVADTVSSRERDSAQKKWWDLKYLRVDQYFPSVAAAASAYTQRLPVEVVARIFRHLACTQGMYETVLQVAPRLVTHPLFLGPSHQDVIGPVFFQPAWEFQPLLPFFPRLGDSGAQEERLVVARIRKMCITPKYSVPSVRASTLWSSDRWPQAREVSLDLLSEHLEANMLLFSRLDHLQHLLKLDVRFGGWVIDSWSSFTVDKLYPILRRHPHLEALSITIDVRATWDYRPAASIDMKRLVRANDTSRSFRPRLALRELSVIAPSCDIRLDGAAIVESVGQLRRFELVCSTVSGDVTPAQFLYLILSTSAATIETIRVVVLDDPHSTTDPSFSPRSPSMSLYEHHARWNDGDGNPFTLPALRHIHLEACQLPVALLFGFRVPQPFTPVLRIDRPWLNPQSRHYPAGFSFNAGGAMGPFPDKKTALDVYMRLFNDPVLVSRGHFTLFDNYGRPFAYHRNSYSGVTRSS